MKINDPEVITGLARRKKALAYDAEVDLALQMSRAGIKFESQFLFHPVRKFRADFCIKESSVLIEIDGGIWYQPKIKTTKGGVPYVSKNSHGTGSGILAGMEKANEAAVLGYWCLRFTPDEVRNGSAIIVILRFLGIGRNKNFKDNKQR